MRDPGQGERSIGSAGAGSGVLRGLLLGVAALFIPAGTLAWGNAWLFLGSPSPTRSSTQCCSSGTSSCSTSAASSSAGHGRFHRVYVRAVPAAGTYDSGGNGLDRRYLWSHVPGWATAAGVVLVLPAFAAGAHGGMRCPTLLRVHDAHPTGQGPEGSISADPTAGATPGLLRLSFHARLPPDPGLVVGLRARRHGCGPSWCEDGAGGRHAPEGVARATRTTRPGRAPPRAPGVVSVLRRNRAG